MPPDWKREFVSATLRFKKVDICSLSAGSIHVGELVVMGNIATRCNCPGSTLDVAEISRQLHVSKPAVSQMLNSLEKKGCIVRQINPDDRRRISVETTPKGQQVLDESTSRYDDAMELLLQRFGAEEMQALVEQLNRLADIYEELLDEKNTME